MVRGVIIRNSWQDQVGKNTKIKKKRGGGKEKAKLSWFS